ncbi:phosphoribosylaminoimidazolesuccinocarboxamide synthase [Candidatus Bathyarchaeota archaeon]|nr:phosphoribosylaminoimidazolesuccinocarboxamide synthase [Candidatus Bathyarchaeota archaeon]
MNNDVMIKSDYSFPVHRRGKVRDLYDLSDSLLIVSTDRISAFDVVFPNGIPKKGSSLNNLSAYWFEKTQSIFPNHFIEKKDERSIKVVKANRIDIEFVARSYLYGSAWRSYSKGKHVISGVNLPNGLQLAEKLPEIILTPTTKSDVGHDLELSKSEALERKLVSRDEWIALEEATLKLYEFYTTEASRKGLIIPDFKLEFGKVGDQLIQIDEPPTHDSARLWSKEKYEIGKKQEGYSLDKEFLRDFLIRKGYMGEGTPPNLPTLLIEQISTRCVGAYKVLTGQTNLDKLQLMSVDQVIYELKNEK